MNWLSVVAALTKRIKHDIEARLRTVPLRVQGVHKLHVQHGDGELSYALEVADGQNRLVFIDPHTGLIVGDVCLEHVNDTQELAAVADAIEALTSEVQCQ